MKYLISRTEWTAEDLEALDRGETPGKEPYEPRIILCSDEGGAVPTFDSDIMLGAEEIEPFEGREEDLPEDRWIVHVKVNPDWGEDQWNVEYTEVKYWVKYWRERRLPHDLLFSASPDIHGVGPSYGLDWPSAVPSES